MMQDRFRIDTLTLVDFRCFGHLTVALDPELTLLVGPNGQGKSAIIDGLAAVCGAIHGRTAPPLRPADVRIEIIAGQRKIRPKAALTASAIIDGRPAHLPIGLYADGRTTVPPEATNPLVPSPVLARYPADRLVTGGADPDDRSPPQSTAAWWNPRAFWPLLVTWIRRETLADLQGGGAGPALRAVRGAVVECLKDSGITDLYYDVRSEALRVVFRGTDQPFDLASGGVKALVAMVADFATRAVLTNPDLGERAPAESPGLLLVDEVELHLHPTWQRAVLPALRRVFPQVQMVATTHSPQVVGSVEARCVRVVSPAEIGSVNHARGRDTNTLLEDVFDAPVREERAAKQLHALFQAIDEGDPTIATKLAEAERELGLDDPDVARARFLLSMGS